MSKLFKNVVVYILISLSVVCCLVGGAFAVGEKPFEWKGRTDFLDLEGDEAWLDPEVYLGYTAQFNSIEHFEYKLGNMVDGEFVEYGYVSLQENARSLRNIGDEFKVTIVDYYVDTTKNDLWYMVEAVDGYELPVEFLNNPYVLYLTNYDVDKFCSMPTLTMLPSKGMINGDVLTVKKAPESAARYVEVAKEDVPEFFDVTYVVGDGSLWYGYDLGDITSWSEVITSSEYRYVDEVNVTLVPVVVTVAYEELMATETYDEYNEVLSSIPERILEQFSSIHTEYVEEHGLYLRSQVVVNFEKTVTVGDKEVPVFVSGNILGDYDLSVTPVSNDTVMAEGFDIENVEDIVVALDIKIVDNDGNEWQPENNQNVFVSIGVSQYGLPDGKIVRLHHKHEDEIYVFDNLYITEGKVFVNVSGFSIYVVEKTGNTQRLETINNNGSDTIYVGQEIVYYNTNVGNNGRTVGSWYIEDPSGAIHYTVHSNTTVGNGGMTAPWISIVALKETTEPVTLTYRYGTGTNSESFKLNIVAPKATNTDTEYQKNGKRLYIKDTVNTTGTITAALTDLNGNDISEDLEGAMFSWERDDGLFIIPEAYKDDYQSIDIARDHGGLVEGRPKKDGDGNIIGYQPITYTLTVTLSDGSVLKDSYTVYYQSEIINSSFEFPNAPNGTYTFFPNGYPELYWKTTAPGTGSNRTKDVEYGSVVGRDQAGFNVDKAADGDQFAELNAEAFGALYQDIITVPSAEGNPEYIEWSFSHAARDANNSGNVTDNMFIIFGPTEQAQKLIDQDDLSPLGNLALQTAQNQGIEAAFRNGTQSVKVTYTRNGGTAEYEVWYHSVRSNVAGEWVDIKGEYQVPEGQYRSRVFFVTDATGKSNQNYGNLIDVSKAGQYKHYLVEYYVEEYVDGELMLEYYGSKTEDETEIIYSSQPLKNFNYFEEDLNNYLYKILINGKTYPYDIRYSGSASLYIEKYPGSAAATPKPDIDVFNENIPNDHDYSEYDIVVQIYFRNTVVAVEKNLVLPSREDTNGNGKIDKDEEGMTEEQKLTLLEKLNVNGGYKTDFVVSSPELKEDERKSTIITHRDPAGQYKGYVAMGNEIHIEDVEQYHVTVEELRPDDPEGLELNSVQFIVKRYAMGTDLGELKEISYTVIDVDDLSKPLKSPEILLGDEATVNGKKVKVKIADVTVINTYKEKMTTIHYKAVGNGKVAFIGDEDGEFLDTPTEKLAYYSGKAVGAEVHPGENAVFVGWYTDPSCEEEFKVKDIHGVWDTTTNTFVPNANIINAEEITFYAKFETSYIEINRDKGEDGQTYLYQVHVKNESGEMDIYVSLTCGADGKGSVQILELGAGTYTVTELGDHSWRFVDGSQTKIMENSSDGKANFLKFDFSGNKKLEYWVNEYRTKKNIFNKGS